MAKSCKEIWTTSFIIKLAVTICVVTLIVLTNQDRNWAGGYWAIVSGYEHSCFSIILALFITYIFIDPTKVTELCLLIVTLIQLLVALILIIVNFATSKRTKYGSQQGGFPKPGGGSSSALDPQVSRMDSHSKEDNLDLLQLPNNPDNLTEAIASHLSKRQAASSFEYPGRSNSDVFFYVYVVINIIAIILVLIDILIRLKK